MENKTLISVIMPTYNRAHLIGKAITTIINQTYTDWELIVIDDSSTDNTKELLYEYCRNDERIKYIANNQGKGAASARNCGILNSKGEYIAFLDSDDEWLPNHLYDSMGIIKNEQIDVCFSLWIEKDDKGNVHKIFNSKTEKDKLNKLLGKLNATVKPNYIIFPAPSFIENNILDPLYCYHINTMIIKRTVTEKVGLFNKSLLASEDIDFTYRVLLVYSFCLILDYHFVYNQGIDNLYNFIDRRKLCINELLNEKLMLNKLSFCILYKCKALELRKNHLRMASGLKNKKLCLQECNKSLASKYFTLAYINKNISKSKANYFIIKSLHLKSEYYKYKFLLNITFPFLYRNLQIELNDLSLN